MNMAPPFKVQITADEKLTLVLTNRRSGSTCAHSHLLERDEAELFASTLEAALASGKYADLDHCPLCGELFTRQNRLCLLRDGQIIHKKCLRPAIKRGELSYDDCADYDYSCFPRDTPPFDFDNLREQIHGPEFRYAIQTVSKTVIHLFLTQRGKIPTRHYCLTYAECVALVQDIRDKLVELYCSVTVACAFCCSPVYLDQPRYEMSSGEVVHGTCMERFIRSAKSAGVTFPAKLIQVRNPFQLRAEG